MRYHPGIRRIYEAENVASGDFLRKFTHNVPESVINELANNKYDIVIDPLYSICPYTGCCYCDK